jgi:hypothetical protein
LLLWEADEADHVEDVSGFGDTKLTALLAHRSQFRSTMGIVHPDAEGEVEQFRQTVMGELMAAGRLAGVALGEAFKRMDDL